MFAIYSRYTENAKLAHERFKDRPMSAAQSVVYWTEYIVRHKGAPHLRSHALNLMWYQYYMLDVIAVVLIVFSVVLLTAYKSVKLFYFYVTKTVKGVKRKSE